jgi:hypothetical protein
VNCEEEGFDAMDAAGGSAVGEPIVMDVVLMSSLLGNNSAPYELARAERMVTS